MNTLLTFTTPAAASTYRSASLYYFVNGSTKRLAPSSTIGTNYVFVLPSAELAEGSRPQYVFVLEGRLGGSRCAGADALVSPHQGSYETLVTNNLNENPVLFETSAWAVMPYVSLATLESGVKARGQLLAVCTAHFAVPTPCDLFPEGSTARGGEPATTEATAAKLPRIVRVPAGAVRAAGTQSCTFKNRIWWWYKPDNTSGGSFGLVGKAFTHQFRVLNANAIKQISYSAAYGLANADSEGATRVGFAVGFQIGSTGGGPTVNFQADLNWNILGLSHAEARYVPLGPLGGLAGAADGFPPEVNAAISNVAGQNPHDGQGVWVGQGAHAEVPLLPLIVNQQNYDEFSNQTVTWTTPMDAGKLYTFYVRLHTASHASAVGVGAVTQGKSDFAFGGHVAEAIDVPAQLEATQITLTILDPQYFWETCNIV